MPPQRACSIRLLFALVLLLLPTLCAAEDFEASLERLVADLSSVDSSVVATLITLPKTQAERARVAGALEPLFERGREPRTPGEDRHQGLALDVLGSLGLQAKPALMKALARGDSPRSSRAARLLALLGAQILPEVFAEIRARGWERTQHFGECVLRLGPSAIPICARALESDPSPELRLALVTILSAWGQQGAPHVVQALERDSDPKIRQAAAGGIVDLYRWREAPIHPALVKALESDPDPQVRLEIARMLAQVGVSGEPALPLLFVRYRAAESDEARKVYSGTLTRIGRDLRRNGRLRWWVFVEVYAGPSALLALFLLSWYLLAPRVMRRALGGRGLIAKTLVVALVPAGLVWGAIFFALTRPWALAFLPKSLVPVPGTLAQVCAALAGLVGWVLVRWRVHDAQAPTEVEVSQTASPKPGAGSNES